VTAPRALALSDKQLALLQRAAASLPVGERDHFLQSVAAHLTGAPTDDAVKLLGVEPSRAVVIEDALSGVEAGSAGKFGLVIGVARKGNPEELRRHGAHLVVNDLGELVS
jgi:HAD superfamily hydrolase (TIGR01509 family)